MRSMKKTGHRIAISTMRMVVQAGFTLFCLYAGYRFYFFYQWAMGRSDVFVPRPPSVEGFLPISALLGFKQLVLTGQYDPIHPAGLTIFIAALVIAFFLRKGFCGWICPVGFVSNLVEKASRKARFLLRLPFWADYPLLSLKYLLLAFFIYVIWWQMDLSAIAAFIESPYNKIVDGKMLQFFLAPSSLTVKVLAILFLVTLFFRNFWCRYLCPYGALLGLVAFCGTSQVQRDESLCVHCNQCDKICPASIVVSKRKRVRNPECIGCMECVEECPQTGCLTLMVPGERTVSVYAFSATVLILFLLFWAIAVITGHWHTSISLEEARHLYPMSSMFSHP